MSKPTQSRLISLTAILFFLAALAVPFTPAAAIPPSGADSAAQLTSAGPIQPNQVNGLAVVTIPVTTAPITIDGTCSPNEYGGVQVLTETFTDGNGKPATVYLTATPDLLVICMQAQIGTFANRFGRVYLDPQGDGSGYVYANSGDDAFQVNIPGTTRSSYNGNGAPNGWTLAPGMDGAWLGASTVTPGVGESAEYGLKLGSLKFGGNCSIFGLSVFHHWFSGVGDDYAWPLGAIFDQPRTWQLARIQSAACSGGDIAYVFRGNTPDATSFFNLLTGAGYSVDLIPLSSVLSTNFATYQLIIIADDTGSLDTWGTIPLTASQVTQIQSGGKPILGLGEGGYAFFGRMALFIGWPQGWHGPQNVVNQAATAPPAFYAGLGDPVTDYTAPLNSVGIFLHTVPLDVIPIGLENPTKDHASLIMQGCRLLWGNSGNPLSMTGDGKTLFLNAVAYIHSFQSATPPPPVQTCLSIDKSASPPNGTPVAPGQVITYTLTYTFSNDAKCQNSDSAKIVDSVPSGTGFVPGSASDGITPASDRSLTWSSPPAAGPQVKTFQVVVGDTLCTNQGSVNNQASLLPLGFAPLVSNIVTHPVTCPNIGFPNHNPLYAEDELQVQPYPLVAGKPTAVSVRITNSGAAAQTITIQYQASPKGLGVGLPYSTFASRTETLPAGSSSIYKTTYFPAASGLACFQVLVSGPNLPIPLKTQSCLDNSEDFSSGGANTLSFTVGNPTPATADINLVVDNTCPGWTAAITSGAVLAAVGGNDSDLRTATLQVTPPSPAVLGSGCHIDVQAWIGSQLIGGIRKLDIPPVHLPANITPPWEEPEIVFVPDPPRLGQPGQVCIELANPLDVSKSVTLQFDAADFGAGVGFTPIGTQTFLLPPHSFNRYCIPWTPAPGGTLHRCILVTLIQPGYREMHSQRNVDLIQVTGGLGTLDVPVTIHNPDLVDHMLGFDLAVQGIDPIWKPMILDGLGNPGPAMIMAGQTLSLHLRFSSMLAVASPVAPPANFQFGDTSQVSVGILFDGQVMNGFTVVLSAPKVYVPIIKK